MEELLSSTRSATCRLTFSRGCCASSRTGRSARLGLRERLEWTREWWRPRIGHATNSSRARDFVGISTIVSHTLSSNCPTSAERRAGHCPAAEHLLAVTCRGEGKHVIFSDEALSLMVAHSWPGNVREMKSAIHGLVVLASEGHVITAEDLHLDAGICRRPSTKNWRIGERRRIAEVLRQHPNKADAARALGIPRTTLINKMRRLGIPDPTRRPGRIRSAPRSSARHSIDGSDDAIPSPPSNSFGRTFPFVEGPALNPSRLLYAVVAAVVACLLCLALAPENGHAMTRGRYLDPIEGGDPETPGGVEEAVQQGDPDTPVGSSSCPRSRPCGGLLAAMCLL